MAETRDQLTGIVLAGGRSRRLGQSKPLMQLGGKLMLARVADTLKTVCSELIVVVRPGQDDDTPDAGAALGMHVVADTEPHEGPLAALHAGLAACVTPIAFVTGADHPFLSRQLVTALGDASLSDGVAAATAVVPRVDGELHSLHAVYPVDEWLPLVTRALGEGVDSPRRVILDALESGYPPVSIFTEDEIEAHDPQKLSLLDIDTPDRLGIARRIIAGQRPILRPDIRSGGL